MKEIKVYIANDGTEFTNKEMCLNYECNCKNADFIMRQLGKYPKTNTAIKHNVDIRKLWQNFLLLCISDDDHIVSSYATDIYNGNRHSSHLGHYLQRSNNPLYSLFARFDCIDFFNKIEYDQPYYATHPDEFKGQIITRVVTG